MTVMKSLLLGSAATLVVVAGAQAADLPTKKGAPAAEYVKVCKVGDIAGFIIPGSDTCLKISGYVNAQIAMGNVKNEFTLAPLPTVLPSLPGFLSWQHTNTAMKETSTADQVNDIGYYTRGQVNFDAVTNTAMGPLLAHIELQGDSGDGKFDSNRGLGRGAQRRLRAMGGRHRRQARLVLRLPRRRRHLEGLLLARPQRHPDQPAGLYRDLRRRLLGHRVVGAERERVRLRGSGRQHRVPIRLIEFLHPWDGQRHFDQRQGARRSRARHRRQLGRDPELGGAHLAGVAHNDRYSIAGTINETLFPIANPTIASLESSADTWGFGVIGGVTFNLPMLSAGSKIAFQGAYADGAIAYSGATSPAWSEQDQGFNTNGNGLLFPMADGVFDVDGTYHKSKAWSAAAQLTWKVSPNFEIDPEVSYADVEYDSLSAADWGISPKATAWWVGAVFDWSPVKNLDFALDAIYESSHQTTPVGWTTGTNGAFQNNADGFNGRLHIVRSF